MRGPSDKFSRLSSRDKGLVLAAVRDRGSISRLAEELGVSRQHLRKLLDGMPLKPYERHYLRRYRHVACTPDGDDASDT